jgi:hypothetical protein
MGVKGLWNVRNACELTWITTELSQILAPAVQQRDLTELAITEGFVPNRHGIRTVIVGIDAR